MNKNYRKGYRWELEVKHWLEKNGWLVIRSAGSHGIDLVAVKEEKAKKCPRVRLISCKTMKKLSDRDDKLSILYWADWCNGEPFLAYKDGRKKCLENLEKGFIERMDKNEKNKDT